MNINIRRTGYNDCPFTVTVSDGNASIDLGILNKVETAELASTLLEAAYELCGGKEEFISAVAKITA